MVNSKLLKSEKIDLDRPWSVSYQMYSWMYSEESNHTFACPWDLRVPHIFSCMGATLTLDLPYWTMADIRKFDLECPPRCFWQPTSSMKRDLTLKPRPVEGNMPGSKRWSTKRKPHPSKVDLTVPWRLPDFLFSLKQPPRCEEDEADACFHVRWNR